MSLMSGAILDNNTMTILITDLDPFTNYTCSVSAFTAPGEGEYVTVTGTTDQAGNKYNINALRLSG